MIGNILQFEDLQEICKPGDRPRVSTVEAWAKRIGLRYTYDAQGGMISTLEAVNAAIGVHAANDAQHALRPEELL